MKIAKFIAYPVKQFTGYAISFLFYTQLMCLYEKTICLIGMLTNHAGY